MFGNEAAFQLQRLRTSRPLVHHITNYVTVNDCANMAICTGSAPVMADAMEEMEDMVALAGALVLNIGTLNERLIDSMIAAGKAANRKGIPVILDPVGAGATPYRTETVQRIMDEVEVSILKGNAGEIAILAGSKAKVVGVDSHGVEGDPIDICRGFAASLGCTVAMTGPQDVISDGRRTFLVDNGHDMMESVSGTGCMASTVVASFAAVSDDPTLASAYALVTLGLAGEMAAKGCRGPMSFKTALFDCMHSMSPSDLEKGTRMSERNP